MEANIGEEDEDEEEEEKEEEEEEDEEEEEEDLRCSVARMVDFLRCLEAKIVDHLLSQKPDKVRGKSLKSVNQGAMEGR